MMRIAIAVVLLASALQGIAFAVSQDLQVGGYLNVKGATTLEASVRAPNVTVEAGYFKGDGSQLTNLPSTTETKSVAFIYPYATAEAYLRLPYNVMITSLEVYCNGGTNITGRVDIVGDGNASASPAAGAWAVGSVAGITNYTAYSTLKFSTPTVTGTVKGATITIHYKRN
jgi:hypothetical protein